jgi:hypothetical protein
MGRILNSSLATEASGHDVRRVRCGTRAPTDRVGGLVLVDGAYPIGMFDKGGKHESARGMSSFRLEDGRSRCARKDGARPSRRSRYAPPGD